MNYIDNGNTVCETELVKWDYGVNDTDMCMGYMEIKWEKWNKFSSIEHINSVDTVRPKRFSIFLNPKYIFLDSDYAQNLHINKIVLGIIICIFQMSPM